MRSANKALSLLALTGGVLLACSTSPDVTDGLTPPTGSGEAGDGSSPGQTAPPAPTSAPPEPGGSDAGPRDAGGSDVEEPSGDPMVQLVGRFDRRDPSRPLCAYPGCRVVARFDGTHVSAKLDGVIEDWMDGAPSEWDVVVDGTRTKKIIVQGGVQEFDLAADLPAGVHTVELYKRSEAQTGAARFLGYDFHGGTLLAPPARPKRRIEVVGDSQPAAFGVEGIEPCAGVSWSGMWQNFGKSMGADLGTLFGAEVYGTVYSGKGVVRNIWVTDDETMPMMFLRANPLDPTSTWDFSWIPDVVFVMIGGNDFAIKQPYDDNAPPSLEAFTAGYDAWVGVMREHYPNAQILLVTSPSVKDEEPAGRFSRTNVSTAIATIVSRRNADGDEKVVAVTPKVAAASELVACNGHGTPAFHQRVAEELATVIAPRMGW